MRLKSFLLPSLYQKSTRKFHKNINPAFSFSQEVYLQTLCSDLSVSVYLQVNLKLKKGSLVWKKKGSLIVY